VFASAIKSAGELQGAKKCQPSVPVRIFQIAPTPIPHKTLSDDVNRSSRTDVCVCERVSGR
jgi:hypothetical protein